MTISWGLCWNIDSRKIIWPPRAHFGSENESLKGLIHVMDRDFVYICSPILTIYWTYFIVRRARAFGARLRLLRRPTFWRGVLGC